MNGEFNYNIIKQIAVISQNETKNGSVFSKELNLISFNDAEPRYDLRSWKRSEGCEPQMLKGISLNEFEVTALAAALKDLQ